MVKEKFNTTLYHDLTPNPKNINELIKERNEANKGIEGTKSEAIQFPLPGEEGYPKTHHVYDKYEDFSTRPEVGIMEQAEKNIENPQIAEIDAGIKNEMSKKENFNLLTKLREFGNRRAVQAAFLTIMLFSKAMEADAGGLSKGQADKLIESIQDEPTIKKYDVSNFEFVHNDIQKYLSTEFLGEVEENTYGTSNEYESKGVVLSVITQIEQAKLDVIGLLSSKEYLTRLAKEMKISEEEARVHQNTRIKNVASISYNIESTSEIDNESPGANAYYSSNTNLITLPYDMKLSTSDARHYWRRVIAHEILHESTMADLGISKTAKDLFSDSFQRWDDDNAESIEYFSDPTELLVRKNILDLEMQRLKIKKYGEEFTQKHYEKLVKLLGQGKLLPNCVQLLKYVKSDKFVNMMNSIAENQLEGRGDYYNPSWNYTNPQT
jgi:hypothetical protein